MKISFPHMGNLWVVFKGLLEDLGFEVVLLPPVSSSSILAGARYAPEFICLPFKANMGDYLRASKLGAEYILMGAGAGSCRFSYYSELQERLLKEMNININFISIRHGGLPYILQNIKQRGKKRPLLALIIALNRAIKKASIVEFLENYYIKIGAISGKVSEASCIFHKYMKYLAEEDKNYAKLKRAAKMELDRLVKKKRKCLKIGLVGEIYVLLEPGANMNIEEKLAERQVITSRYLSVYRWILHHLHLDFFSYPNTHTLKFAAKKYLKHSTGGEDFHTIGSIIHYAKSGYNGIIHLHPFGCMPELVVSSILPKLQRKYKIPILSLSLDEHTPQSSVITRIEAFLDMLRYKVG